MGRRGPLPTPTPILAARGSWRAAERAGEVAFTPGAPACPAALTGEARAEWRRVVKELEAAGLAQRADRALLVLYCRAWAEAEQAEARLLADGHTFTTEKGYVGLSPWVAIRNGAAARVAQLAAHFGLSPASRARVKAPGAEAPAEPEGKARFFAG